MKTVIGRVMWAAPLAGAVLLTGVLCCREQTAAPVRDAGKPDGSTPPGRDASLDVVVAADIPLLGDVGPRPDMPVGASNPIVIENERPGTQAWQLTRPADDHEVEGYASTTSAVAGQAFNLYVSVNAPHAVRWEAYRVGHYQGEGGRLVTSGTARPVTRQPACPIDPTTGGVECNWSATFSVTPDAAWVTGLYLIKLVRDDGYESYVPLVVRDASPVSPILFQASVNTWQAYNDWGGTGLYANRSEVFSGPHAFRVSFDRPYNAEDHGSGQLLWWEAHMARWLERRGYPVSYVTNVDVEADPTVVQRPRVFLTVGHDEYWSTTERNALERARDAGVSLGIFSADTGTFHVRYASSSSGVPRRQIICYKVDGQDRDPNRGTALQTTRFALDPIGRPENALLGVMYAQWTGGARFPMVVSNPGHWLFAGTNVTRGETLGFIVGSEWDRIHDNGRTPAGVEAVTESFGLSTEGVLDVSHAALYQPTPTSVVFAAGTLSWALALGRSDMIDPRVQRVTENFFARVGLAVPEPTVVPAAPPPENPGTAASVTLLAGAGVAGYLDGPVATARFSAPAGVAARQDGTVYVTDSRNHRVRVIRPAGSVATLAGCGPDNVLHSERYRDGTGSDACFDQPTGVAVATDGTVYVSDTANHRIRAISAAGVVTTYAGTGDEGDGDSANLREASFSRPRGLAIGPDGALYVADAGSGAVRRITRAGVTTVARDLEGPMGITLGADGRIYVTLGDATVRSIAGGNVTQLAGAENQFEYAEETGEDARMRPGDGVALLGDRLVFADSNNHRVRSLALNTRRVTTLVGDGRAGAGVGTGATTHVVVPRGVTLYRDGLALADSANHRVLYVRP